MAVKVAHTLAMTKVRLSEMLQNLRHIYFNRLDVQSLALLFLSLLLSSPPLLLFYA